MTALLAQVGAYSLGQWAVIAVVVIGIIAIILVVARANGIAIPAWVIQIAWIVFAVFCAVVAIRLLISFL